MLEADVGIVFHHINYAESSVIVKLLSKNHGLISLMIKGAKKKKSSTIAKLQPLSLVAVEYYYSEQKDLHTVRNLDLSTPFKTLHSNPMKATVLLFLNEILFKSIQQQEKNDPVFDFIQSFLIRIDQTAFNPNCHLWFVCKLTTFLGIAPDISSFKKGTFLNLIEGEFVANNHRKGGCSEIASETIFRLIGMEFDELTGLKLTREIRRETLQTLIDYYQIQLEGIKNINSHLVLQELLE
ncbi:MAG: DNA repair protein RecO [Crocinitomicaceae bacterium]|jgi:DNA repair protein RecO (recombination protein O)|nr:DNA repair protein RecO [Crocinitomicaceae bacterium]MBT6515388.1 DNA repair protein RecO [Crocinitomicaceae bacterium]